MITYGKHLFVPKFIWGMTLRNYFKGLIAQSRRTVGRVSLNAGKSIENHHIPAGIDLEIWTPDDSREEITINNIIKILYVGSVKEIRGFFVLLKAFSMISGEQVELHVLARGATEHEVDNINSIIDRKCPDISDRIKVEGGWLDIESLRQNIRAADVVALPFILVPSELPVSVIECIACGTPVITTDIDGLPEAVGEAGIIVKPGSVSDLKKALKSLVNNRELLNKLSANCKKEREKMKSWADVADAWSNILIRNANDK